jgi:hypothetical protein
MRNRVTFFLALFAVVAFASTASAQIPQSDCQLGVYADEGGTIQTFEPTQGEPFTVNVVMRVEGLVTAVAFDLFIPGLQDDIFLLGESFGIPGRGINIMTDGGYNVGIGECAIGFNDLPIVISRHTLVIPGEAINARTISVGPNTDSDPDAPLFSVCTGEIYRCTITDNLLLAAPVDTEDSSFGAVKSLYN